MVWCATNLHSRIGHVFGNGAGVVTWWNWLACGLVMVAYILKARYEDMFLSTNLPGHPAYQQRVRYQLIPGVW